MEKCIKLKNKNLLLLGDSIMFGSGNNGVGVGEYLEKDYGINLFKYCVGGARVGYREGKDWVVEQVRRSVNDGVEADLIVFDGFTNDCHTTLTGYDCDVPLGEISNGFEGFDIFKVSKENTNFSNCFENVVAALKKYYPSAKILFVRPHRMGRRGEQVQIEYGERAVQICRKWGIAVCDLYKESGLDTFLPEHRDLYTNDSYGWGTGDCTHPNAEGYRKFYMPLIERTLEDLI